MGSELWPQAGKHLPSTGDLASASNLRISNLSGAFVHAKKSNLPYDSPYRNVFVKMLGDAQRMYLAEESGGDRDLRHCQGKA
jgi:hypothetical protein